MHYTLKTLKGIKHLLIFLAPCQEQHQENIEKDGRVIRKLHCLHEKNFEGSGGGQFINCLT
jgi:hypothetical protein